jgi:hypothetical protein
MPARGEDESWDIVYHRRADGHVPALEFLDGCPVKVQARFDAVLDDVAAAPPPRHSGGGLWEAMHGEMGGYYEVRLQGPGREQFRLSGWVEIASRKAEPGERSMTSIRES